MSTPNPVPAAEPTPTPTVTATPAPTAAAVPVPEATPTIAPKWPDNWRQEMTGGDEKEAKQAERYASPADVWKKARALEQRLSSGELKSTIPYPDKGTPEQQAAWRKDQGVPDAPDKYDLKDLEISESNKPIVQQLLAAAHEANLSNEAAASIVRAHFNLAEQRVEERSVKDTEIKQATTDHLRKEWGADYRVNLNNIHTLLNQGPEGMKDLFLNSRMPDGSPLGSNSSILQWLASVSRQVNPISTLMGGTGNSPEAVVDEIAQWETKMRNSNSDYWKGPNADKNQQRFRDLITARDQVKK